MFEIDKRRFGAFISGLRKEKGYTQKALSQRLFISDKAVSKWETGASLPDTSLLVPLAELLGVSVTELLMCERVESAQPMDTGMVEAIVKRAIGYSKEQPQRGYQEKSSWKLLYIICAIFGMACFALSLIKAVMPATLACAFFVCAGFGIYFVFLVRTKLPECYDENRISAFADGPLRLNLPGLALNNTNWPHIVRAARIWSCAGMAIYPPLSLVFAALAPEIWKTCELAVCLIVLLGGLFVPLYVVGKKYE